MGNIYELYLGFIAGLLFVSLYLVNTKLSNKLFAWLLKSDSKAKLFLTTTNGVIVILLFGVLLAFKEHSK